MVDEAQKRPTQTPGRARTDEERRRAHEERERTRGTPQPRIWRSLLVRGGHLAALWAVAVAQPLLDLLGRNPDFFAVRGSTPRDIVLFTVALTLAPPAAMLAAEALAAFAHRAAAAALHLVFIAALGALIILQAGNRVLDESGLELLALALAGGLVAAAAYARVALVRFAVTVLLPAPILVGALFLFNSPVSDLLSVEEAELHAATIRSETPVVLIVFDELPTVSLMNERRGIDASRYPNFGALAEQATWYRNATTVSPKTERAVPAILTGKFVGGEQLPVLSDHPDNIFTLLGSDYELRVAELATNLCPPELCGGGDEESLGGRFRSLGQDLGAVFLHLVVPDRFASGLPPVGDTWSDFFGGAAEDDRDEGAMRDRKAPLPVCARGVCNFAERIARTRRPVFFFYHGLLPHVPWFFLPSGRRYLYDVREIPGTTPDDTGPRWADDAWLIQQAYQRHLLQLGYTDRALGLILDRLRSARIYDEALVVVTADHGGSFEANTARRWATPESLASIAFVPLFVKLPGQKEPRVEDGFARTIDVVPTIADALATEVPWRTDGESLLGGALPRDATVIVVNTDGSVERAPLAELVTRRGALLARQLRMFGAGNGWKGVYAIGPKRELIGTEVGTLPVIESDARVELAGENFFRAVDPSSGVIPAYVQGTVLGTGGGSHALAIAVNGRIAGTTRTYPANGEQFAAMLPDDALVEGDNEVRVYLISAETPTTLAELRGSSVRYTLRADGGSTRIEVSDGSSLPVRATSLRGEVDARWTGHSYTFRGWAYDPEAARGPDRLLVFADDVAVFYGPSGNFDPEELAPGGVRGQEAGFRIELLEPLLPERGSDTPVRFFAVYGGVATELEYTRSWPWPQTGTG